MTGGESLAAGGTPHPPASSRILGVDGLKAFSVLAVLLYHLHLEWALGGFLGVEVFFVISGFLITGLLLKEHRKAGRIDLGRFFRRRALRLLPAVLLLLLLVAVYGWLFLGGEASQFRADLLASLFYTENWHQISSGNSYFADQGLPLLRHLWSLSVEEQFYLAWPLAIIGLVALGRTRRWILPGAVTLLAAGSLAWGLHLAQPFHPSSEVASATLNRVYLGTDTRALGLLLGSLLAMAPTWRPDSRALGRVLDLLAILSVVALLALMATLEVQTPFLYRGGFLVVDVLTLLILLALTHPQARLVRRGLGWAPLEWIGRRSYGFYLWHWPVFLLLLPGHTGWAPLVAKGLLTWALTYVSFRFLEDPILSKGLSHWFREAPDTSRWRPWVYRVATLGLVVIAQFAGFALGGRPAYVDPVAAASRENAAALDRPGAAPAPIPGDAAGPGTPVPESASPAEGLGPGKLPPPIPMPQEMKGVRLTVLGDSVMKGAAIALKRMGEASLGKGHILVDAEESRSFAKALALLRDYKQEGRLGEVVVIHLGTNNSSLPEDQFRKLMAFLSDRRLVLFLTAKSGKVQLCEKVNQSLASFVSGYPNARLLDWKGAMEAHPEAFYADHTHLRPEGAIQYASFILTHLAEWKGLPPDIAPAAEAFPLGAGKQP